MRSDRDLQHELERIDRRGYPAYKDLRGQYDFGDFALSIDHVQGDPFASPSSMSVRVPNEVLHIPAGLWCIGGWRLRTCCCAVSRARWTRAACARAARVKAACWRPRDLGKR